MRYRIIQQFFSHQVNNGGPATGYLLLRDSYMSEKYEFVEMSDHYKSLLNLKLFLYYFKTIREQKPDLVHIRGVQLEGFWGVLAAKLQRRKVIMSVHGLVGDLLGISPIKRFLFRYLFEKYALKKADCVYCVCAYAANRTYIIKQTKHLYGYIHNAAPDWTLDDKESLRKALRDRMGVTEDDLLYTYVGRLTTEKGVEVLIHSFIQLREKTFPVKLCLVGDGHLYSIIAEQYEALVNSGIIILAGKQSQVKSFLCASDVFVLPSFHENLSNSLLEAATVGLPIIATGVGGNGEIVEDGKTGLLVGANNEKELLVSMQKLYSEPELRKTLGHNASVKVSNEFSKEKIINEIDSVYCRVIEGRC